MSDCNEQFESLIDSGEMIFNNVDLSDLCLFGRQVVSVYLKSANIKWKLGNIKIGNDYVLSVDDEFIKYLYIYSDSRQFMFCGLGHQSIHPDKAHVYLLAKVSGCEITYTIVNGIDRYEIIKPDGRKFIVTNITNL